VDVGTTNIWSDQARKMALDNLFTSGAIDIIQYLERLDDSDIPDRQGLIDDIKSTMTDQQFIQGLTNQYVQALPMDIQAQLAELQQTNPEQYEQTVRQMMGGIA
jgi:hypothetical protein